MRYIVFGLFIYVLTGIQAACAQEPVFPSGSAIGLVPPASMVASSNFSGFEDAAKGTSIVVTEFPKEAYADLAAKFNAEGLRPTGVEVVAPPENWPVSGAVVSKIIRGSQVASGIRYRKWLVLVGGQSMTGLVTVQIPDGVEGGLSDAAVEQALATLAVRPTPGMEEQISALPFKVADRAGFRPIRVIAGATYILTDGASDTVVNSLQPVIIVASNLNAVPDPQSRMDFARKAFGSLTGIKDVTSNNETSSQDGSVEWVEIDGGARDTSNNDALYIAQVVRFEENRYVRAILIVRESERNKYSERFNKLARSMKFN